jgi:hypothetical protein
MDEVTVFYDWLTTHAAATVIVGLITFFLTRVLDARRFRRQRLEDRRRLDISAYEMLVRDWHKILDIEISRPELCINAGDIDPQFEPESPDYKRRLAAYNLLFNLFGRLFVLQQALKDGQRLGTVDSLDSWDVWVTEYFKRPSIVTHFLAWEGEYFGPGVDAWLRDKISACPHDGSD